MDYYQYNTPAIDILQVLKVEIDKSPYYLTMGFWENVVSELNYKGLTNKALAEKCGFDASSIGRGIKLGSSPSVETAVKIAKVLDVSVEYLAGETNKTLDSNSPLNLGKKYYNTLKQLELLPEKQRNSIIQLIKDIGN